MKMKLEPYPAAWWVDQEGKLRMRETVPFEKSRHRQGCDAQWAERFHITRFDIQGTSWEEKQKMGIALFQLFEKQHRSGVEMFLEKLMRNDINEIPDYMTCMRLILEGWRQITTLDKTQNAGQPVRVELIDREGNVIAVAE